MSAERIAACRYNLWPWTIAAREIAGDVRPQAATAASFGASNGHDVT
jgi:hypothetical protein